MASDTSTTIKPKLTKQRSPEWTKMHTRWEAWRLCYEGGDEYIEANLDRFSKRETISDFEIRKTHSYNPAHATLGINVFRDSLLVKMPDIQRTGDKRFIDAMNTNVDMKGTSMSLFMGNEVAPLLMSCAKRIICLDTPYIEPGARKSDEPKALPYLWAVDAEDLVAWSYDDNEQVFRGVMLQEWYDTNDEDTGFVIDTCLRYRLMWALDAGTEVNIETKEFGLFKTTVGKKRQVLLRLLDENDVDLQAPVLLDIPRLPVVIGILPVALMKNVARIQRACLNLNSTDMSFLWRGNFPQQVRQVDVITRTIRAKASKRPIPINQEPVDLDNREADGAEFEEHKSVGPNRAITHGIGTNAPSYIAPPVENCQLSMQKQDGMKQEIKTLLDQGMVSIGKNRVQQSADSKKMDRVGVDTGLAVTGRTLESMEREVAEIYHLLLGSKAKWSITYPKEFTVKTFEERLDEADKLNTIKTTVSSETFSKEIDKQRIILMEGVVPGDKITKIHSEIMAAPWIDFDKDRAGIIAADLKNGICPTKEHAAKLRRYPADQVAKAAEIDKLPPPVAPVADPLGKKGPKPVGSPTPGGNI